MPRFALLGKETRVFHDYGLLEPGDTVEAKENPDPVWFGPAKEKAAPAASTKPEGE